MKNLKIVPQFIFDKADEASGKYSSVWFLQLTVTPVYGTAVEWVTRSYHAQAHQEAYVPHHYSPDFLSKDDDVDISRSSSSELGERK